MDQECRCENYLAGVRDVQRGKPASPYQLIYLRHPGCYRAGQHDERRAQIELERRRLATEERANGLFEYQS